MAVVNQLSADIFSLRGADEEFNRISRFFRTKAEAEAAIAAGDWVPQAGVLNACLTGDFGLQLYTEDTVSGPLIDMDLGSRAYMDSVISGIIGDAPATLDTLSEITDIFQDDPDYLTNLVNRVAVIENGTDFQGTITAHVGANVIPFYYQAQGVFPQADTVHGAIAHSHEDGGMYFAHAGSWHRLANQDDVDTAIVGTDEHQQIIGVTSGDIDLGTFNGSTIGDNKTIKEALQSLETYIEAIDIDTNDLATLTGIAENVTNLGQFAGTTIADGLSAKDALQALEHGLENEIINRVATVGTKADATALTTVSDQVAALPTMIHASWNASTAGSFDFANDAIASSGVSSVTRTAEGIYRVTFTTAFASDAYTVTCGVGSTDYSGTGASPREVSILARNAAYVDVICERSDDAVNEDNAYMSVIIMG